LGAFIKIIFHFFRRTEIVDIGIRNAIL